MVKGKCADRWRVRYPEKPVIKDEYWDKYDRVRENWRFSHGRLTELNSILNERFKRDPGFSVLVAGSYGRMDAHEKSDLDFMIVHDGSLDGVSDKIELIRESASTLGIDLPNSEGAFSKPIRLDKMIEAIGSKEDDLNATAQRQLILMEGRPVYNEAYYEFIIDTILTRYLRFVVEEPGKEALVLLNDVIKYFRNICVNVEFNFWNDESKWGIRSIKLGHSRALIYAGLLLLILNSSKYGYEKIRYLHDHIYFSPIEKVYLAYADNDDPHFERVIAHYNIFLHKLADDEVRHELKDLGYADRFKSSNYIELKDNSDSFRSELTRFILDNRMKWTPKIFECLIF
jgi:predicted nucleotidyltransferase